MNFEADLERIVKSQFDMHGIVYDDTMDIRDLATCFLEMTNRRISRCRRNVVFSDEIHSSIGALLQATERSAEEQARARDAWWAVYLLRQQLANGDNVNGFLSKNILHATGRQSRDGLLWDYGMHHFHLSKETDDSRFALRSDYLLFAIVAENTAYFVDVMPHRDPQGLQWVRQDLLKIVHSNWPELIERNVLHGVSGTCVTDEEKKVLRGKNANLATNLGGVAIAPLGGGVASDGSSILCRDAAMRLLHEIKRHQTVFASLESQLPMLLGGEGFDTNEKVELELVLLDSLDLSTGALDALNEDDCLSKILCQLGFVVLERITRTPVVVSPPDGIENCS